MNHWTLALLLPLTVFACNKETRTTKQRANSPTNTPSATENTSHKDEPKNRRIVKTTSSISKALLSLPLAPKDPPAWGENVKVGGPLGVVTSVEDSATRIGVSILERGGNAVDAAVATAFALAVTHPSAGNIGGGGFMLLKIENTVEAVDFRENSPNNMSDDDFWKMIGDGGRGPTSVGVPGTVAGLYLAHSRHGALSWQEVVQPAETLAKEGYLLGKRQAKTISWAAADLRRDTIAAVSFFGDNRPLPAGSRIKRPGLAMALERIRIDGPSGFYEGPTADDIIESLGNQALLTHDDLKAYKAKLREPLFFDFKKYRVITMPAPSAGGVALTQSLLMLKYLNVDATLPDSVERLHLIAEASRRAQVERQLYVVSPDALTDNESERLQSRALSPLTWLKAHPIDPKRATKSSSLHPGYTQILSERKHTTHISVIDKNGGLVSCTVTLSGSFGSRRFTKKTGIALNNSVGSFSSIGVNTPQPGQRTTSSMAPTLVLQGKNRALVLGSPGGDTIPSTIVQVFLRLALDGDNLEAAVAKPRIHQGFVPEGLSTERTRPLPVSLWTALSKLGHRKARAPSAIGDANIAGWIDGNAFAVSDSREGGLALAAQPQATTKGRNFVPGFGTHETKSSTEGKEGR